MTKPANHPMSDAKMVLRTKRYHTEHEITISWALTREDASCWEYPIWLTIELADMEKLPAAEQWTTEVSLSREDARVIRDFLTTLLGNPDYREVADN